MLNEAKRYPKHAKLYWMLGILYRDTGRISKAERALRKAVKLDKSDAIACRPRGGARPKRCARRPSERRPGP